MDDSVEEWKPIVGYEGVYEVSNWGRVKRVKQSRGCRAGHILSHAKLPNGYRVVTLSKDNIASQHYLHRVVAAAFIGIAAPSQEVNHKDLNKDNNSPGNLEYLTRLGNQRHAVAHKAHAFGERCGQAKLTSDQVREIRKLGRTVRQKDLADQYGVCRSNIGNILTGKIWKQVTDEILPVREAVCSEA